jgi:linoleate 10R-lipoxygenase
MYMVLAVIFACIFLDLDPAQSFPLHMAADAVAKPLGKLIEANVKAISSTDAMANITENKSSLKDHGVHMIQRLLNSGLSAEETAWSQVFPTAIAMVPSQAQVVCYC